MYREYKREDLSFDSNQLMIACKYGKEKEVKKLILHRKCNLNAQNVHGVTALMFAIGFRQFACAKILIESRCDVNIRQDNGKSALELSANAFCGSREIVVMLINNGSKITQKLTQNKLVRNVVECNRESMETLCFCLKAHNLPEAICDLIRACAYHATLIHHIYYSKIY